MTVRLPKWLLVLVLLLVSRFPASGSVVVTWPTSGQPWMAGTPAEGATASETFNSSAGTNDVTLSINNSGNASMGNGLIMNPNTPCLNRAQDTGGFSNVNGVQLIVDHSNVAGAYLQVTVSFAYAVTNLSFQIWDVDIKPGSFIDKIYNLQGLSQDGVTLVGASSVTNQPGGYNSISGTGLGTTITGLKVASDTSNQGTIDITFNQPITQFSFQYTNDDTTDLGQQGIALGPLSYDIVPESDTLFSITAACATVIGFEWWKRRPRKRESIRHAQGLRR